MRQGRTRQNVQVQRRFVPEVEYREFFSSGNYIGAEGTGKDQKVIVWGQTEHHHGNQYAHGQITPVLAVITGGTMLSIPAFNRPNGTEKAFLSERLMMKDDMLVTLLSVCITAHHASLSILLMSCCTTPSRKAPSVSRLISSSILRSGALADSHIHRRIVGGELCRAC